MCGVCGCSHEVQEHHPHSNHSHVPHDLMRIEKDILAKNDSYAQQNRIRFSSAGVFALNLVSSPGSGKTTLLVKTLEALRSRLSLAVIEGDQETSIDADLIRGTGVPSVQINTGRGCHLDAHMVGHALDDLPLVRNSLLFVENIGNLVCPAHFDLGETQKVAILSVAEGDNKPIKYPDMFAVSSTMILSKIDLLPHVEFDVDRCIDYARSINPDIAVFQLSARTGDGMDLWLDWLAKSAERASHRQPEDALHA